MPVASPPAAPPAAGLSEAEAARRLAGRPRARPRSSRSYTSIVVANVVTVFNAILLTLLGLTLIFGDPRDALFGGIVVANATIGIAQEVRAKRALDRLSALVVPRATVLRDGAPRVVGPDEVVVGDLVAIGPGDQLVADGTLRQAAGLRLDESILTGESAPVARGAGEPVRSGAFVVEGVGRLEVEAVGEQSYASRLAGHARTFRHPRSPLERALNRLLLLLVAGMVPLATLLVVTLALHHTSMADAVPKATAAMTSLVPEGLILLASLTFAVAAARMAGRGALAQQLNAIESLASVDVVCLDKTGTLTEGALSVVATVPAAEVEPAALEDALRRYAAATSTRNLTAAAIAERWPAPALTPAAEVPFASRRRWGAVVVDGGDGLLLGAPELLGGDALAPRAAAEAAAGRRVVAVAEAPAAALLDRPDEDAPPPGARTLGLAVLSERLRPSTAATVRFLLDEGVALRVLSGDAPATVGAIARDAGIPSSGPPLDGRALPEDPEALVRAVDAAGVVGRISPEGKLRVVEALRDAGRYVAMVGDGVNDVPALKASRLAIAQGSGAQMATSVADVVLVSGDFSTLPEMVREGRRILRNVQRVAKLFVTKTAFAAFLIVTIGTTATEYPFLPRHLTVASTFGVGLPGFFLALAPSAGRWRSESFLRDVARFAIPGGLAAGIAVLVSYLAAIKGLGLATEEGRTVATTVLLGTLLFLLVLLEGGDSARRRRGVEALVAAMAAGYALVLAVVPVRDFFALAAPTVPMAVLAALGLALGTGLARLGLRGVPGR
ncbi:MAG TPA: HAD-IC family P-type ATPase [Baekduia sp.]|nr:HAD-IC family P-type ATPase [Baekduia sp.]